jgi:hypothetical protein
MKKSHLRDTLRWEDSIKRDLKEMGCDMNWIGLVQYRGK